MYYSYCAHHEIYGILSAGGEQVGKTSSAVKDRYNAKTYDEIKVRVNKGRKAEIQAYAEAHSQSVNSFINSAIDEKIERDCGGGQQNAGG